MRSYILPAIIAVVMILVIIPGNHLVSKKIMQFFVNDHNDAVLDDLDKTYDGLKEKCKERAEWDGYNDPAFKPFFDRRYELRNKVDRTDPWIGILETANQFAFWTEISTSGQWFC